MASQTIILRYTWQLGAEMTKGGFGRIYAAEAEDGSQVVVKLIPKAPGASRELLFEPLSGLSNIIPILDSGEWQDFYVLVMPYAEKSLRQHLDEAGGKLTIDDAVPILLDVAEALAGLGQGVVHRDLKPENVLLYQGRWCLADFGIARYAEATTAPDTHKYSMTPPYAAPEQWRVERTTAATDVYAFGVMAFELLQGQRPFPGPGSADFREQHLNQTPPALTRCPPSSGSLVTECLYKAAQARPTPANIVTRLRASTKPPSPAVAKLQAANQRVVDRQAEEGATASAQKSTQQQRMELVAAANHSLGQILNTLVDRIREAAPAATVSPPPSVDVRLGSGALVVDSVSSSPVNLSASPRLDVIAYTLIEVHQPLDPYGYEGRSHSLWFCDTHDAGVYRWFETAFMIHPLVRESSTVAPFALAPSNKDAVAAFSSFVVGRRQIAWEPVPFDQGNEEQFIERWLEGFAEAVNGTLRRPSQMPETSGGRHR